MIALRLDLIFRSLNRGTGLRPVRSMLENQIAHYPSRALCTGRRPVSRLKQMEPPPDPPTLEYATPEEKPVVPTNPVVGILGFLLYGGLFLLFSAGLAAMARQALGRHVRLDVFACPGTIFA